MKITNIETFPVKTFGDGAWIFCAVRTDIGLTGYGEFGTGLFNKGLPGLVQDIGATLIGKDPRAVDKHFMDMYRLTRSSSGGATAMAIAGIELALWDVKGKDAGVPVYEFFGGPHREEQRVYWSHLGTYRAMHPELFNKPVLRDMNDIGQCAVEAVEKGYSAFKTNLIFPGDKPFTISNLNPHSNDQNASTEVVQHAAKQMSVMRDAVGPDIDICLDINYNFKTEGAIAIGKILEPYDLFWMEIDNQDPRALAQVKSSQKTPICTGEQLLGLRQYRPFLEAMSMDTLKIDVQWQGFSQAKKVADLAETYDINIAPHNYNSHLSSFQSLNLTASVSNVRIMESDVDSAPWRDEITTEIPHVKCGYMSIPKGAGWGCELNEEAARKYVYTG